jgi:type IV pilus assembly protein PilQ
MLGLNPGLALAGSALKDVSFSALPGNKVQIRLILAGPAMVPTVFSTDSPARLVLDFPDTSVTLTKRTMAVGIGAVHKLTVVEAGNRSRVVLNLDQKVPYHLQTSGNMVLLTLDSGLTPTAQEARSDSLPSVQALPGLQAIDFHRGPGGEGRVLITLDNPNTMVDVKEEGRNVVLSIPNASLPPALHQKLDVVDFATPVQSIVSEAKGNDVRVTIQAAGEYEYLAYQVDRMYTVELRPLTQEEQEKIKKQRHVYTGERLSLNFQDIPVRTVLHLLGDFTNRNMVISDTVKGNITLRLKNVPWDQALDIILKTKFLDKRDQNNVTYIAPAAELLTQEQTTLAANQKIEELAPLHSELIRINYADADDIAAVIKSAGSVSWNTDYSRRDIVGGPWSTRLRGGSSRSTTRAVSEGESLLSARGHITVHRQTNSLLIQDTAEKLAEIRGIIAKLDIPVKQVLIESRIVIANNDFARDLGVRFGWSGAREIADGNVANIAGGLTGHIDGTYGVNKGTWLRDVAGNSFNAGIANDSTSENLLVNLPVNAPTGAVNFLIGKIGSYLLQLELSAMQTEGRGEIISSPRVVTTNREKALIQQGVEIPYQESSSSGATSVAFKKAVLSLEVTPRITADSRISMKLEVNKDSPDFSREVNGVPPVDTRAVRTTVMVDNGETVVLGGVYERTKTNTRELVPFFGDIPLVGNLFKRTTKADSNTELLIFVTPKILSESQGSH